MIVCNRCGKENQDHYKFCLGCGAELSAGDSGGGGNVGTMKTMMAESGHGHVPTPPGGVPHGGRLPGVGPGGPGAPPPGMPGPGPGGYGGPPRPAGPPPGAPSFGGGGGGGWGPPPGAPPHGPHHGGPLGGPPPGPPPGAPPVGLGMPPGPAPAPATGPRKCSQCGSDVPANFKFCGVCGSAVASASPVPAPVYGDPGSGPAAAPHARAQLTLIRPDGSEGGTFALSDGTNRIGRDHGSIFESDGYLSPTHCELVVHGGSATVRDLDSLNGVFVRMTGEEEIQPGQVIRMGQELLRFDLIEPPTPLDDGTEVMGSPNPGYWGKITVIIGNGVDGSAYPLLGDSVALGRERGDINFPDDGYVSGLHARLSTRGGKVYLADLGSSNGTFLRVQGERTLGHDSFVLLGQQLFRVGLR